jgi:hypothetical protein
LLLSLFPRLTRTSVALVKISISLLLLVSSLLLSDLILPNNISMALITHILKC